MDPHTDLQAQVIALRNAVESLWLSMLHNDPDRVAHAGRLRESSVAALGVLQPNSEADRDILAAVIAHTDRLWTSIESQTAALDARPTYPRGA